MKVGFSAQLINNIFIRTQIVKGISSNDRKNKKGHLLEMLALWKNFKTVKISFDCSLFIVFVAVAIKS